MQEGIQLVLSRYPQTMQLELGVAAMGVESPEGTFIQTGAQLQRLRSATDLTGGAGLLCSRAGMQQISVAARGCGQQLRLASIAKGLRSS